MPYYRGNSGPGRFRGISIPSTTGLRTGEKLVTCARSGVLVPISDTQMQGGYRIWVRELDAPTGDPRDD